MLWTETQGFCYLILFIRSLQTCVALCAQDRIVNSLKVLSNQCNGPTLRLCRSSQSLGDWALKSCTRSLMLFLPKDYIIKLIRKIWLHGNPLLDCRGCMCVTRKLVLLHFWTVFSFKFWMILSFLCFSRCFSHDCFIGWILRPILGWETEFVAFFVWSYCAVHPCFPSCPNWTPLACSLIWMQFYPYRATTVHKYYPNVLVKEKRAFSLTYNPQNS